MLLCAVVAAVFGAGRWVGGGVEVAGSRNAPAKAAPRKTAWRHKRPTLATDGLRMLLSRQCDRSAAIASFMCGRRGPKINGDSPMTNVDWELLHRATGAPDPEDATKAWAQGDPLPTAACAHVAEEHLPPQVEPSLLAEAWQVLVQTGGRERAEARADTTVAALVNQGSEQLEPAASRDVTTQDVPKRLALGRWAQLRELAASKLPHAVNYVLDLQAKLNVDDLARGMSKRNSLAFFVSSSVRLEYPNLVDPSPENLRVANHLCSKLLQKMSKGEVETHKTWANLRTCDKNDALKMAVAMIFIPTEGEIDAARLLDSSEVRRLRAVLQQFSAGRAQPRV